MFKSNKGFTLVELIVVIAILAILAGVAIPVYNGYIKRAQDAAVVTELDAIQTAAQAANATSGEISIIVVDGTTIKIGGSGNKLASGFASDFVLFYPDATADASVIGQFNATIDLGNATYKGGATWKNGDWAPGTETVPTQEYGSSLGGNNNVTPPPVVTKCDHANYTVTASTDATCTAAGSKTYTCQTEGCDSTYTETVAALGHKDTDNDNICDVCKADKNLSNSENDLGWAN